MPESPKVQIHLEVTGSEYAAKEIKRIQRLIGETFAKGAAIAIKGEQTVFDKLNDKLVIEKGRIQQLQQATEKVKELGKAISFLKEARKRRLDPGMLGLGSKEELSELIRVLGTYDTELSKAAKKADKFLSKVYPQEVTGTTEQRTAKAKTSVPPVAETTKAVDSQLSRIQKLSRAWGNFNKALKENIDAGHHVQKNIFDMIKRSLLLVGVLGAVFTAFEMVKRVISEGFKAVEEYKKAVAGMAAMSMMFSKRNEGESLSSHFQRSYFYAKRLYDTMEDIADTTLLTGEQANLMAQAFLAAGVHIDTTSKVQVDALKALGNAVAVITQTQDKNVQVYSEIKDLLQGRVTTRDLLGQALQGIDPEIKSHIQEWKKLGAEALLKNLLSLLAGYNEASKLIELTWEAVGTRVVTSFKKIARVGFAGIMQEVLDLLNKIDAYMTEHKVILQSQISKAWEKVKNTIVFIYELFMKLKGLVWDLVKVIGAKWIWGSFVGMLVHLANFRIGLASLSLTAGGLAGALTKMAPALTAILAVISIGLWNIYNKTTSLIEKAKDVTERSKKAGLVGVTRQKMEYTLDVVPELEDFSPQEITEAINRGVLKEMGKANAKFSVPALSSAMRRLRDEDPNAIKEELKTTATGERKYFGYEGSLDTFLAKMKKVKDDVLEFQAQMDVFGKSIYKVFGAPYVEDSLKKFITDLKTAGFNAKELETIFDEVFLKRYVGQGFTAELNKDKLMTFALTDKVKLRQAYADAMKIPEAKKPPEERSELMKAYLSTLKHSYEKQKEITEQDLAKFKHSNEMKNLSLEEQAHKAESTAELMSANNEFYYNNDMKSFVAYLNEKETLLRMSYATSKNLAEDKLKNDLSNFEKEKTGLQHLQVEIKKSILAAEDRVKKDYGIDVSSQINMPDDALFEWLRKIELNDKDKATALSEAISKIKELNKEFDALQSKITEVDNEGKKLSETISNELSGFLRKLQNSISGLNLDRIFASVKDMEMSSAIAEQRYSLTQYSAEINTLNNNWVAMQKDKLDLLDLEAKKIEASHKINIFERETKLAYMKENLKWLQLSADFDENYKNYEGENKRVALYETLLTLIKQVAAAEAGVAAKKKEMEWKTQYGTFSEGFSFEVDTLMTTVKSVFTLGSELASATTQAMKSAFSDFFDVTSDNFMKFGKLAVSVLTSIQKKMADMLSDELTNYIMKGIKGLLPSTSSSTVSAALLGWIEGISPAVGHSGGLIMHSGGIVPKFHSGGLSSDERSAILQTGEYVVSRKGVQALDKINSGNAGNNISVLVNVENKSSQEVNAKAGEVRFDGKQYITNIILEDAYRNGPISQTLRR